MADDAVGPQELVEGWDELLAEVDDEIGRPPTGAELAELLTWALRAVAERVDDLPAAPVVESARPGGAGSVVPDLGDAAHELATALVSDAVTLLTGVAERPRARTVLDVLGDAFARARRADGVPGGGGWRLRPGPERVTPGVGDIVAVPLGGGRQRHVLVVARNRFGTAVAVLEEAGTNGPWRATSRRPVYVGTEAVEDGSWPVVGHDEGLLDIVDREPELFFAPFPGRPSGSPFGSAERPDGSRRDLTEEEARKVGLLDRSYSPAYVPEQLQAWLARLDR